MCYAVKEISRDLLSPLRAVLTTAVCRVFVGSWLCMRPHTPHSGEVSHTGSVNNYYGLTTAHHALGLINLEGKFNGRSNKLAVRTTCAPRQLV